MKMNEMDEKETSKWMKMDRNHPKWMEIIKNRDNPVVQNEAIEPKWIIKINENHSK